jgi:thiol-disulfide isomerase/thioredoxin
MNKNTKNRGKKRSRSVVLAIAAVVCLIVVAILVHSDLVQRTRYHQAYKFSLIDLEGKEFTLADYEGKVVVLDFMGPSWVPCREQVVEFDKVYDAYSGRVEIISICVYAGEEMR